MSIKTLSELFLVAAGHQKSDCLLHKVDGGHCALWVSSGATASP
jgi:hypothetical protein